jgi:ABC-2 type transport system permease protein
MAVAELIRDSWLVFLRTIRPVLRSRTMLLTGMLQPLLYLVLFGPLVAGLGGPTAAGGPVSGLPSSAGWQWFAAGLLVQLALFGTAYAGFGLIPDLRSGVHERLRATPVRRSALLLGRVARDVVLLIVQAALLLAVATAFGLRAPLPGVLAAVGLLALLGTAVAAVSYALAALLRNEYTFAPVLASATVPLMLLSGVLLPMSLAPRWLRALAWVNPLSHVVDAQRALVAGGPANAVVAGGFGVAVVGCAAALAWAVRRIDKS